MSRLISLLRSRSSVKVRQEPRQNAAMMPHRTNDLLLFFINLYWFCGFANLKRIISSGKDTKIRVHTRVHTEKILKNVKNYSSLPVLESRRTVTRMPERRRSFFSITLSIRSLQTSSSSFLGKSPLSSSRKPARVSASPTYWA